MKRYEFDHIVAAGSWDHFHLGHEEFLKKAFATAKFVSVGITAEKMLAGKVYANSVDSFGHRRKKLKKYLKENSFSNRSTIIKISDIYGPTLTDMSIEGILVTQNTLAGGRKVNDRRRKLGLNSLQLIKVELENADDGEVISSERVRQGKVSRSGLVYLGIFESHTTLKLPQHLRRRLSQPFGQLIPRSDRKTVRMLRNVLEKKTGRFIFCVGDVVTRMFLENKLRADLYIVDYRVERKITYKSLDELGFGKSQKSVKTINKAGEITAELVNIINQSVSQLHLRRKLPVILVKGEEDLAVLPVILAAPLKALVLYGQPNEGVVLVEVTEDKKAEAYGLIRKFDGRK